MSGNSFLLDTNIALYLLSGDKHIAEIIDHYQWHVSFITELELLSYTSITTAEQKAVKQFLSECIITDINAAIKKYSIQIRQNTRLRLPDCIIAATAMYLDAPLLTADKDFQKIDLLPIVLYQV
jgi:hypothetical protein